MGMPNMQDDVHGNKANDRYEVVYRKASPTDNEGGIFKQAAGPYPFYLDSGDLVGTHLIAPAAFQLAFTNRYSGAFGRYSVACHSLQCVSVGERTMGVTSRKALYAMLMHDIHESMVGDVVSPVKRMVPEFGAFEDKVAKRFYDGLMVEYYSYHDVVKEADLIVLEQERNTFSSDQSLDWGTPYQGMVKDELYPPWLALDINPMSIAEAFLHKFLELCPMTILIEVATMSPDVEFKINRTINQRTAVLMSQHQQLRSYLVTRARMRLRKITSEDGGRMKYYLKRENRSALSIIVE